MARLGDIATYINGYAFKPSDWSDTGLPIIRIQDLTGNSYQANRYNGEYAPKYEVNDGDVLISWSASLGVYVWHGEKALLNQHIFKVVFDKTEISKTFFVHQVENILEKAASEAHGATMKHLTKPVFDALPFYLPPIDEQRKIAAVLDKVSDLIAKRRQQLDKLDEMVKVRFVEMFGDVIQNTKLWPQYIFSDITTSRLGKMLDAKQQTGMYQCPYLANFNVQWFRFELDNLNEMDFNEADRIEFELRDGDLLVCEGGEIGRCAVWHNEIQPCYFQKALHRVRCKKEIVLPNYLAWWFKFNSENKGFAAIEGAKATISHLPGAKLKALLVPVPPIEHQKQFDTFVEQTEKTKTTISRSLEKLETLKKALMQEYFG